MSDVVPIFGTRSASRPASPVLSRFSQSQKRGPSTYDFEAEAARRSVPALARLRSLSPSDVSTSSPSSVPPELSPYTTRPLLASPPPIQFTQEPRQATRDDDEQSDDWDTDAELDFQLNQLGGAGSLGLKAPQPDNSDGPFASQPFGRALSVAALALLLTALLK